MEYHDSAAARDLRDRARAFVDEAVIPTEREYLGNGPVPESVIADLRAEAREREVYVPQLPEEWGGLGYSFRDALPLFEEAGRSLLGATAMHVAAPDEGNMHTIDLVGTEAQKEQYLAPLVAGEIRSAFSMTEPSPGGGSDPKMLRTRAERVSGPAGDEWVIDGHKWWTTQGSEADVLIVMARTDMDRHPYEGTSLFLVDADADGVEIVRDIPHLGQSLVHESHAEIRYDGVRVSEDALLGTENMGFAHAQQRLGPARLTHCIRFTGMAMRALTVAKTYAAAREGFGSTMAEKESVRHRIADMETRLHACRTMIRHAADDIAAGGEARISVAMAKTFCAGTTQDAIDLALQCCGGAGISRDLPIADFYEAVRAFRIIDGADEVHRRVIARDAFDESKLDPAELANLPEF